jgi:hypothetical protein
MTALLEFQRTLAQAVMQPLTARDNMRRGNRDGVALVKPNSRLTAFERLEIYNRSYWSRVLDAFSEDFPGVRALVGAAGFDRLRRAYLADCPSGSFTMRDLGQHLVAWLETHSAYAEPHTAAVLDMAKLEWAEIESFDAAEHERLAPEHIAALDPTASLQLQPHIRLLEVTYPVDSMIFGIRKAARRNGSPARTFARTRVERAKSAAPIYLAIHRHELVVHYKRLDKEEFRLLRAISEGVSIEDAVARAYADSTLTPDVCTQHLQNSFALFSALGWFSKSRPADNTEAR